MVHHAKIQRFSKPARAGEQTDAIGIKGEQIRDHSRLIYVEMTALANAGKVVEANGDGPLATKASSPLDTGRVHLSPQFLKIHISILARCMHFGKLILQWYVRLAFKNSRSSKMICQGLHIGHQKPVRKELRALLNLVR